VTKAIAKVVVGTKLIHQLDNEVDRNQNDIVNTLLTPHSTNGETKGAKHRIVASYPVHQETQPVQARGHPIWNKAYDFQSKGPSYLDPVPDPGLGGGR
jgi:hypothetical protein